jgi:hypothetical protein
MYHPYGQIFFGMRLPLLLQRQKAKTAIRIIHSWQPQRILLIMADVSMQVPTACSRIAEYPRL